MAKKKTRPISQRDMTLSPTADILRRFLFLAYLPGGAAGVVLLAFGIVRHRPAYIVAGLAGVIATLLLHLTRARWGADKTVDELKSNPFQAKRVPKDEDESDGNATGA